MKKKVAPRKSSPAPLKEASAPTSRIVPGKAVSSVEPRLNGRIKATSEADWLRQEAAELAPVLRTPDVINNIVGRTLYMIGYGCQAFEFPGIAHKRFQVSRFYPHQPAIAFDKPATVEEQDAKTEFFKAKPIIYLAVAPNESLTPDQLRERLEMLLIEKSIQAKAV